MNAPGATRGAAWSRARASLLLAACLLLGLLSLASCDPRAEPEVRRPYGNSAHLVRLGLFRQRLSGAHRVTGPELLVLNDGRVLYHRQELPGDAYAQLRVPPASLDSVLALLGATPTLATLDTFYDIVPDTAEGAEMLYLLVEGGSGQRLTRVRVVPTIEGELPSQVPVAFRTFYSRLQSLELSGAQPWEAESVLVQVGRSPNEPGVPVSLWRYSRWRKRAPGTPARARPVGMYAWPDSLPELADSRWKRGGRDSILDMILLSRAEFTALGLQETEPRKPFLLVTDQEELEAAWRARFPAEAGWVWVAVQYHW